MPVGSATRAILIAAIACSSTGCVSRSLDQFIDERVGTDDGFRSAVKACKAAQDAYHLIADTPLDELRGAAVYEKAARLVTESRDAYRRASTYAVNSGSRRLDRNGVALRDPNKGKVPMGGVTLLVAVMPEYVELKQILSSRGKEILSFDSDMKLVVEKEFRPFLTGDEVRIDTDFLLRIRRALNDRERIDVVPHKDDW